MRNDALRHDEKRGKRIAGAAEVESILAERGDVEVTCEFCNRRYTFGPAEARAIFPETVALRDLDRVDVPRRR